MRQEHTEKHVAPDARQMALAVLLHLQKEGAVQAVLDKAVRASGASQRDTALCTELVYGFLRTELRLHVVLGHVLRNPEKLPHEMRLALGLAAYALLFLQRVPDHATVDWTVRLVRKRFGQGLSRVANGALRSLQRLGDAPLHEEFYTADAPDPLRRAALMHSVPWWMAERWLQAYGEKGCLHLLERSFRHPWPCLRINACHSQAQTLRDALVRSNGTPVGEWGMAFAPGESPARVGDMPLSHWMQQGVCSWQAAGSQEALFQIHAKEWPNPVWDACAGQGGKTMALLEQGVNVRLCSDIHGKRLTGLRADSARLGLPLPLQARSSMIQPCVAQWRGSILLDIPCSGLGTLSRRPEIRRRRTPQDIRYLTELQKNILQAAWEVLGRGGELIYMTCTVLPEENEQQIRTFLSTSPSACMVEEWQTPLEHPWMEGMYAARLRKG